MSEKDEDEISRIFEVVQPAHVRNRDVPGYAGMFSHDAIWCPPNNPDRYGPAEIGEAFAAVIANMDIDPVFNADEVKVILPFGYVLGRSTETLVPHDRSPSSVVYTRELWLFRKDHETWKIARMIWTPKPSPG